jgi:riboflavin synthase
VFSGIVERVGTVERAEAGRAGLRLAIRSGFESPLPAGASVSVNGVCLTVEQDRSGVFEAVAVEETLRKTTLGSLGPGARVNLERAVRAGDPLGGHWVQGHTDAVATIRTVESLGGDVRVGIEMPRELRRFVAEKGSISVDGISLTVAAWEDPVLVVALVPYTLGHTIASEYRAGGRVNVEVDIVARYLERLLDARGESIGDVKIRTAEGRTA